MTQQAAEYQDCDIPLESGRLRVRRWGAADAPAAPCVPSLSANLCGFDRLAERLAGDSLQLVAIDLRGRGRSEVTSAGSTHDSIDSQASVWTVLITATTAGTGRAAATRAAPSGRGRHGLHAGGRRLASVMTGMRTSLQRVP